MLPTDEQRTERGGSSRSQVLLNSDVRISRHPEVPKAWLLETEQWFPRTPEAVFGFFGDAGNLEAITPPWLSFRIVTPQPISMSVGTVIDYRLRLHGIPFGWQTKITAWEPSRRFIDEQIRGPYRIWIHEHQFEPDGGGTRVRDAVTYCVPGGELVHRLLVGRDLRAIFAFRRKQLSELLGGA